MSTFSKDDFDSIALKKESNRLFMRHYRGRATNDDYMKYKSITGRCLKLRAQATSIQLKNTAFDDKMRMRAKRADEDDEQYKKRLSQENARRRKIARVWMMNNFLRSNIDK